MSDQDRRSSDKIFADFTEANVGIPNNICLVHLYLNETANKHNS